jgi:hypothetical protein
VVVKESVVSDLDILISHQRNRRREHRLLHLTDLLINDVDPLAGTRAEAQVRQRHLLQALQPCIDAPTLHPRRTVAEILAALKLPTFPPRRDLRCHCRHGDTVSSSHARYSFGRSDFRASHAALSIGMTRILLYEGCDTPSS